MPSIRRNVFYLLIVQMATYISPLITLPYLAQHLGLENFGKLFFYQAIIQYFILITDYGFNITATRAISMASSNRMQVSRIFTSTTAAKIFLTIISFPFLLLFLLSPQTHDSILILIYSFIGVIGNALYPIWLFQGLEIMRPITIITCAAKFIPIPLLFIYVKSPSDIEFAAILQNIGNLISSLFALSYIYKKKLINPTWPKIVDIKEALRDGAATFLSNISISLYTTINIVLLGFLSGQTQVAFFSAAEKIRLAAQGLIQPISGAVFPRVVSLNKEIDKKAATLTTRKWAAIIIFIEAFAGIIMLSFSKEITKYYLGENLLPSSLYIEYLSFLPIIIAIATVIGHWRLLAFGKTRTLSRIYIVAGLAHLIYAPIIILKYATTGLISSLYITETCITVAMIISARKKLGKII